MHSGIQCPQFLVAYGADVDSTAPDGNTALLMASLRGHATLAATLVLQGASPIA